MLPAVRSLVAPTKKVRISSCLLYTILSWCSILLHVSAANSCRVVTTLATMRGGGGGGGGGYNSEEIVNLITINISVKQPSTVIATPTVRASTVVYVNEGNITQYPIGAHFSMVVGGGHLYARYYSCEFGWGGGGGAMPDIMVGHLAVLVGKCQTVNQIINISCHPSLHRHHPSQPTPPPQSLAGP